MGDSKRVSRVPNGGWGRVRRAKRTRKADSASASAPVAPRQGQAPALPPVARVSALLERWFPKAARKLPWRRRRTGWTSLVSEALLQQTQVVRVAERFPEFMRLFPTPKAMALAGEGAVLKAWRGLGYYRRARSLHAAAVAIVQRHGGRVPSDVEHLRALPGVGRYTAGAVASIAFGKVAAIVDGNVMRVLSRLADRRAPVADRAGQAWCWEQAERLACAAGSPGVTNEALMELGATVCTPVNPRCDACPLAGLCRARAAGSQAIVPPPKPGAARRVVVLHALVPLRAGAVGLEVRTEGLWKGLLAPPLVEAPEDESPPRLAAMAGAGRVGPVIAAFDFQTTHRAVRFVVHAAGFAAARGLRWVPLKQLEQEAVSAAALRVVRAAASHGSSRAARLPA